MLDRTYYRNEYIFWRQAVATEFIEADDVTWRCWYPDTRNLLTTFRAIARSLGLSLPFENLRRDLRKVMIALREHLPGRRERQLNFQVQVLSSLFFRDMGAYVVGRLLNGNQQTPFVACLRHAGSGRGLYVDALLVKPEHLAGLFSLSRAYFIVDMDVPSEYVAFLNQLMPGKSKAELYTSVGLQKQGKTLFYRDLHASLKHSTDAFVLAPGAQGLVMMVFTLPSFPWVFKVIRDEFRPPKQTTREEVRAKYLLVKYHDRVGRLPDALEYSDVLFPAGRMDPRVLSELERSCARSVDREGDRLVLKHLYVERRMTPLDLWLDRADLAQQSHAIREFGRAIRDLADANIFPGDLLDQELRNHRARTGGVLRLRRDLAPDRRELPANADGARRGGGGGGRAVVSRGCPGCVSRGVPALPVSARAVARAVPRDARGPAGPGVVGGPPGRGPRRPSARPHPVPRGRAAREDPGLAGC